MSGGYAEENQQKPQHQRITSAVFVNHLDHHLLHVRLLNFCAYVCLAERLLLFCADTELNALYSSEFIICDGTFEMAPDTSYQYFIPGVHHPRLRQCLALAWTLHAEFQVMWPKTARFGTPRSSMAHRSATFSLILRQTWVEFPDCHWAVSVQIQHPHLLATAINYVSVTYPQ